MFRLGWLLAELFAGLNRSVTTPTDWLPSLAELSPNEYVTIALNEVTALAGNLAKSQVTALTTAWSTQQLAELRQPIRDLNQALIDALLAKSTASAAAFQLGTALGHMCHLPDRADPKTVVGLFDRARLSALFALMQEATSLSSSAIDAVRRSIQNWRSWLVVNMPGLQFRWTTSSDGPEVLAALRRQGEIWRPLLSESTQTVKVTEPEVWVLATESVFRNVVSISRRLVARFSLVVLTITVLFGLLIYYVHTFKISGESKGWSTVVSVAAYLGVTGTSLRAGVQRVGKAAENQFESALETQAQGWEVTWLPAISPGVIHRRQLAAAGITVPRDVRRERRLAHAGLVGSDTRAPAPPRGSDPRPPIGARLLIATWRYLFDPHRYVDLSRPGLVYFARELRGGW